MYLCENQRFPYSHVVKYINCSICKFYKKNTNFHVEHIMSVFKVFKEKYIMSTVFITFILYIPTYLDYHLKQEFRKYFVQFGFYSYCRKVNLQFFNLFFLIFHVFSTNEKQFSNSLQAFDSYGYGLTKHTNGS